MRPIYRLLDSLTRETIAECPTLRAGIALARIRTSEDGIPSIDVCRVDELGEGLAVVVYESGRVSRC